MSAAATAARWTAVVLIALAALAFGTLRGAVWVVQESLLFGRRTTEIVETPADRDWRFDDLYLQVNGATTHGWWLPQPSAAGVVLFSHGSGRNISGYLEDAALFRALGLSVLLYDYGGYGLSTGAPTEARCYADVRAMWDYLVHHIGIPPERIILAGSSLGGGVTAELARHVKPAAVILESSFTSVPDAVSDTLAPLPGRWLNRIQFRNLEKIAFFDCPVLIVHSRDDKTIPFSHGLKLYQRAAEPKMFLEIQGAHYGGKFSSRERYLEGLGAFIEAHVPL